MKCLARDVKASFGGHLPEDAIPLDFIGRYTGGELLYVHRLTGILSSSLQHTPEDILDYWSNQIFESTDPADYDSELPFARARLTYVLATALDFMRRADAGVWEAMSGVWCDYATGKGTFLKISKLMQPQQEVIATEASAALCAKLADDGFKVVNCGLGFGQLGAELPARSVDAGFLSWTLCNCIDPLHVLLEIRESLKDSGFLVVAESSRILVPFRKSLSQYLSPRHPQDCHPFHYSHPALRALFRIAGFTPVYANRWQDSDVLLIVARKAEVPRDDEMVECVPSDLVFDFMKEWHRVSEFFDKMPSASE